MRFWDSSAVVPLLVEQEPSHRVSAWAAEDDALVLWTLTPVEVVSALRRLVRERTLDEAVARRAEDRMDELVRACHVIIDVDAVKSLATRLLRLHPLRAFDAMQLGAALHWAEGHPQGRPFLTLDARLALAAQREGFAVPS
ncbi:MAG: type II toxin-antitoxin system VapC family toxin [Candidatus Rokubacteria bacterium]|nr:type II toxin-antitoxin system VapC family toxin [Candidatus Rokubacteria bacterium]